MVRAGRIIVVVSLACVAACGESRSDAKEDDKGSGAAKLASGGALIINEASRKFLVIEPVAGSGAEAPRSVFGRTAFRPKALSAVTAPFAGRVGSVAVEPGQRVKEGAALFTIESADALGVRSSLEQARLREKVAEEVLARQSEMVRRGVGLEVERFEADMKLREARSERQRLERNTALIGAGESSAVHVRSPVNGVVVSVKVTAGSTVQPGGEPLMEIGNPGGLWVVADVPEGEAAGVSVGTKAEVTISALNTKVTGRVAGIAPRSDAETRRTPVYVELDNAPAELRAGLLVQLALADKGGNQEIWLPVTAVLVKEGGRRVVYLERADGQFVAREIEAGDQRSGRLRVLKGLAPGERVVMRGALLLDREAEQLL